MNFAFLDGTISPRMKTNILRRAKNTDGYRLINAVLLFPIVFVTEKKVSEI